jgi:hypothetical protein
MSIRKELHQRLTRLEQEEKLLLADISGAVTDLHSKWSDPAGIIRESVNNIASDPSYRKNLGMAVINLAAGFIEKILRRTSNPGAMAAGLFTGGDTPDIGIIWNFKK